MIRENFADIQDLILYIEWYCLVFSEINEKEPFLNTPFKKFQNLND